MRRPSTVSQRSQSSCVSVITYHHTFDIVLTNMSCHDLLSYSTFVVIRYWINSHFSDDFLISKSLRCQMASFLNSMRSHPRVQASPRDSRIIRSLMDFFKYQRRYYKGLAEQSLMAEQRSGSCKRASRQEFQRAEEDPSAILNRTESFATKGRDRASTLAGPTLGSMVRELHGNQYTVRFSQCGCKYVEAQTTGSLSL